MFDLLTEHTGVSLYTQLCLGGQLSNFHSTITVGKNIYHHNAKIQLTPFRCYLLNVGLSSMLQLCLILHEKQIKSVKVGC